MNEEQEPAIGDSRSGIRAHGHETSLAVWDLTSPVVINRRPTLKVGVACASGCNLSGSAVAVYNEAGGRVAAERLGSEPWPGTAALYWVELELAAPEREDELSLSVHATPTLPHNDPTSVVTFVVSSPPEHRVTLRVIDKTAGTPLSAVELRIGRFRTASDAVGTAWVDLPGGTYEIGTWKNGYEMVSKTVVIGADITIDLELTAVREPDQPYWM